MRLQDGIEARDPAELSVCVGVAEGVAQRDETSEFARVADARDLPVLHRDHRRAGLRVDRRADERPVA